MCKVNFNQHIAIDPRNNFYFVNDINPFRVKKASVVGECNLGRIVRASIDLELYNEDGSFILTLELNIRDKFTRQKLYDKLSLYDVFHLDVKREVIFGL